MKIKENFVLRELCGSFVVVAGGEQTLNFKGLIKLNETGAFLWERLMNHTTIEELCADMVREYDIDESTAKRDIEAFIKILSDNNLLEQ